MHRTPATSTRTEAVELALDFVRRTGHTAIRGADGTPSPVASLVAFALLRGAESVQAELDRYIESTS